MLNPYPYRGVPTIQDRVKMLGWRNPPPQALALLAGGVPTPVRSASSATVARRSDPANRAATAYHEAGHALASFLLFGRTPCLEILNPTDDRLADGLAYRGVADDADPFDRLCHWVSGGVAEALHKMQSPELYADLDVGDGGDHDDAVEKFGATAVDSHWESARRRMFHALEANWQAVHAVAAALDREGCLRGDEVRAILDRQPIQRLPKEQ